MASDAGEHEGSAALRPQELGIGRLFESVRDAIVVADADKGRVVLWNPAAAEIFGYSPEEALGMLVEEIVPERLRAHHRAGLARYWETGHGRFIDSRTVLELPAVRRSGEEITIELTLSPIDRVEEDEEGRYVLAIIRDVTARVRSEQEVRRLKAELERRVEERTRRLERSEERYRTFIEQSTEGIWRFELEEPVPVSLPEDEQIRRFYRLAYLAECNDAMAKMYGYRGAEQLAGARLEDLLPPTNPENVEYLRAFVRSGYRLADAPSVEPDVEGRERHFLNNFTGILEAGALVRAWGTQRDVTAQKEAEEELRGTLKELAGLKLALDESAIVAITDVRGRITYVNERFCEISGYSGEELIGMGRGIVDAGHHPEEYLKNLRRTIERGRVWRGELKERAKDGSIYWTDTTIVPFLDEGGRPYQYVAISHDITERKQAEEKYRSIFENAIDGIFQTTAAGRFVTANPAMARMLGYDSPEALISGSTDIGRQVYVDPEDRERLVCALDERGTVAAFETRMRRKDGERIWVSMNVRLVRDENGRVLGHEGTVEDVTARKRAEAELKGSEERYRAVVEQSTEGIYLLDAGTGRILDTNPSLREMLGYTSEEMRGMSVYDLIAHPKEDVDANLELTLREGRRLVGERRYRRRDGSFLDVEVGASTIRFDGRDIVCAVVRDVTGRKRAEETLREVRGAERARMARDLHDGPLQDLAYALKEIEIVQALSGDPELEERLGMAIDALARAGRDLRSAVYDLRRGDEQSSPFPKLLEALIESNRSMMDGCEVVLEAEGNLPSGSLGGMGTELLRILQEALSNVRRHAAARRVRVRVGMEGGALVAEVADEGRGFPPGTRPGVGFRSMRERTEVLGGELEVESRTGEGTRVRVRVPLPGSPRGSGGAGTREHTGLDAGR